MAGWSTEKEAELAMTGDRKARAGPFKKPSLGTVAESKAKPLKSFKPLGTLTTLAH